MAETAASPAFFELDVSILRRQRRVLGIAVACYLLAGLLLTAAAAWVATEPGDASGVITCPGTEPEHSCRFTGRTIKFHIDEGLYNTTVDDIASSFARYTTVATSADAELRSGRAAARYFGSVTLFTVRKAYQELELRAAAALVTIVATMSVLAACSGAAPSTASHPAASTTGSPTTGPPSAPASGPGPVPVHGRDAPGGYLALGDSVAFGYRPTSVTPARGYLNPANFIGYPEDIAKTLRLHVVNASCPGETTSSMINSTEPSNGCETGVQGGPGYRSLVPLHVGYGGSQLSYAARYLRRHPQTMLVTVDIGANDLFLCQQTTADYCAGADFDREMAKVTANLNAILSALRNQAHYRHALVVLTYYALNYSDSASVTQTRRLDAAITEPAARYDARIADGFAAFRAASMRSAGDTCAAGLRIKLPTGGCDLHPSALGQRVLAAAIQRALAHPGR